MRRHPIYLLLDTSSSMRGEAIEAVKSNLQSLISSLKADVFNSESIFISVITYDSTVKVRNPLTSLKKFTLPFLDIPRTSLTNTGAALEILLEQYRKEIIRTGDEPDYSPIVFIMTDGTPSDTALFKKMIDMLRSYRFAKIIGLNAGPPNKRDHLELLTKDIYNTDMMDRNAFSQFWKWVSEEIKKEVCKDNEIIELPPPPDEIHLI